MNNVTSATTSRVSSEAASGASSVTTSVAGRGASSHKGKRCTSNPIKDKMI